MIQGGTVSFSVEQIDSVIDLILPFVYTYLLFIDRKAICNVSLDNFSKNNANFDYKTNQFWKQEI